MAKCLEEWFEFAKAAVVVADAVSMAEAVVEGPTEGAISAQLIVDKIASNGVLPLAATIENR